MAKKKVRDSWRPQAKHGQAVFWLTVRRGLALLSVVLLVTAFIYLIVLPLLVPQTYFVYMTSGQRNPANGPPIAYAFEDFTSLTPLVGALAPRQRGESPLVFTGIEDPRQFNEQLDSLQSLKLGGNDRLLLYVTAHGTVQDGEPYLLCSNYATNDAQRGRYPVAKLLDQLRQLPGKTKLLILDSGREPGDFRSTESSADFLPLVTQQVRDLGDSSLWVMTANAGLERSHVSPALRQSVFGYVLSRAMNGAADANGDKTLQLGELYRFVRVNVERWVELATDGVETQTPQLIHVEAQINLRDSPPLLALGRLQEPKAEPDVQEDVEAAQAADTESTMSKMASYIVGVSGQFGIPSPQQIEARTRGVRRLFGGGGEDEEPEESEPEIEEQPEKELPSVMSPAEVQRRLDEAWRRLNQVEQADPANPELAAASVHRFHRLGDELTWYDALHRAGHMIDQNHVAEGIKGVVGEVDALAKYQPAPPFSHDQMRSFALAERIALESGEKLPPELKTLIAAYDIAIAANAADPLTQLLETQQPNVIRFHELGFANKLLVYGLDWATVRLALQTQRAGEQAAADLLCGQGWGCAQIEGADRLRWEAQRLLASRAENDWLSRAKENLSRAQRGYQDAQQVLRTVRSARQTRDLALGRLRDVIRWSYLSGGDPDAVQPADVTDWFGAIRQVDAALKMQDLDGQQVENPLAHLRRSAQELEEASNRIVVGLPEYAKLRRGNGWRMQNLVRTQLLDPTTRTAFDQQIVDQAQSQAAEFRFQDPPQTMMVPDSQIEDTRWNWLTQQLELEYQAADLAQCATDEMKTALRASDPVDELDIEDDFIRKVKDDGFPDVVAVANARVEELASVAGCENEVALAARESARWHEIRSATDRINDFYRELPVEIRSSANTAGERSGERRAAAFRDLHLLAAEVPDWSVDEAMLVAEQSVWHAFLLWQSRRSEMAQSDALTKEQTELAAVANYYMRLANDIPDQPLASMSGSQRLRLEAESDVSLDVQPRTNFRIDVESEENYESPVWIVLQYNSDHIRVRHPPGAATYAEHDLRRSLATATPGVLRDHDDATQLFRDVAQRRAYPFRPDLIDLPATLTLAPKASGSVVLSVERLNGAVGQSQLVVKAIGAKSYVRRQATVHMPGDQLYHLVVEDPESLNVANRDTWTSNGSNLMLMPFPNRPHQFAFQLQDAAQSGGAVEVEVFLVSKSPVGRALPEGAVDVATVNQLLLPYGTRTLVGKSPRFDIPRDGAARILFEPPAQTVVANPKDKQPLIVSNGLVMVIKDVTRNKAMLRRIHFAVQRPSRYLESEASYNEESEQLTVNVRAINQGAIPRDGLSIKLSFAEDLGPSSRERLGGRLTDQVGEVQLYRRIPREDRRRVTAYISVEDYPRAFVFDVNCAETQRRVAPQTNLMNIRVVSPASGSAYQAQALSESRQIQARVEIDAPEDSFAAIEGGLDYADVALDRNGDRDLTGEETLRLYSDRQVRLEMAALGEDGAISVLANVGDHELMLPAIGLSNERPKILGRLVTGDASRMSQRPDVEITVDGAGPRIPSVDVRPNPRFRVGDELEVWMTAIDDLTAVASASAGFDTQNQKSFEGVEEPADAKQRTATEWVAKVKVPDLPVGKTWIWVKITDRVGNSTVRRYNVEVIPQPEVVGEPQKTDAPKQAKRVSITGRLRFGRRGVRNGKVRLLKGNDEVDAVDANAGGSFRIDGVLPGNYRLEARGVSGGNAVNVTRDVKVPSSAKSPMNLGTLQLR